MNARTKVALKNCDSGFSSNDKKTKYDFGRCQRPVWCRRRLVRRSGHCPDERATTTRQLKQSAVPFCKQQSCLPRVSCHSVQLLTVQELVGMEHGISLIPEMAASIDHSKRRKYRSMSGAKPTRTLAMIWRKQRYQSPVVKHFIEALRCVRQQGGK